MSEENKPLARSFFQEADRGRTGAFLDQMEPDAADEQTARVRPGRMSTDGGRIVEQTQSCPCVEDAVAIAGQWGGA